MHILHSHHSVVVFATFSGCFHNGMMGVAKGTFSFMIFLHTNYEIACNETNYLCALDTLSIARKYSSHITHTPQNKSRDVPLFNCDVSILP